MFQLLFLKLLNTFALKHSMFNVWIFLIYCNYFENIKIDKQTPSHSCYCRVVRQHTPPSRAMNREHLSECDTVSEPQMAGQCVAGEGWHKLGSAWVRSEQCASQWHSSLTIAQLVTVSRQWAAHLVRLNLVFSGSLIQYNTVQYT